MPTSTSSGTLRPDDTDGMEAFLEHWRQRIRQTARNLLGRRVASRADTSDVAQEGIVQAWQQLVRFRGESIEQLDAWTRRIGAGHAAKIRRYHLAERRSAAAEQPLPENPHGVSKDPADSAEQSETLALVAEALDTLNAQMKSVVLLRVFENATFQEIAVQMELPKSTVQSIFGRAIKELHAVLSRNGLNPNSPD